MASTTSVLTQNLDKITRNVQALRLQMQELRKGSSKYLQAQAKLNKELAEGVKVTKQLAAVTGKQSKNNKNQVAGLKQAELQTKKFNKEQKLSNSLTTSGSKGLLKRISVLGKYLVATAAITAGIAVLKELFVASAKRAIALESALGDVAAIAGLSAGQVDKLKVTTLQVAGATKLTTIEVVALQKELAKLGSSADEIQILTRPIALLSQALGETGEVTAQTIKKIQNQFGLTAEEVSATANTLVGAVNESALTMNDLATGLQYVGPLAAQAGISFSETASMLGVLANNGFKASRAGTGLRTILIEAAKQGKPVNELFKELAESGLSVARATELFTKRGAAAAITLVQQQDELLTLNDRLNESDRLFNANAAQMSTTQGQLDLLSSAYNKASTSLGEYITNTNIFIELIAVFDRKAAGSAGVYRLLRNATRETRDEIVTLKDSLRTYTDETDEATSQTDLLNSSLKIIRDKGGFDADRINDFYREINLRIGNGMDMEEALLSLRKSSGRQVGRMVDQTLELLNITKEQALVEDDLFITQSAKTEQVIEYRRQFARLNSEAAGGQDVEDEKSAALVEIQKDQLELARKIQDAQSQGPLRQQQAEDLEIMKAELNLLNKLEIQFKSLYSSTEENGKNGKEELETIRERIRVRKEQLENDIQIEKDTLASALFRAKGMDDIAEREEAQAEARLNYAVQVSKLTKQTAADVGEMVPVHEKNQKIITKAVDDLLQKAKLTESDGIKLFGTVQSSFLKAQKELDELVKEGSIGQKDYEVRSVKLREAFEAEMNELVASFELEGETALEIQRLIGEILNAPYDSKATPEGNQNPLEKILAVDPGAIDAQVQAAQQAIGAALDVFGDFAKEKLDNLKSASDAELDVIKERYSIEEDILKSNLDNQLITEGQFRVKSAELKKAQLVEENAIEQKVFESQKKQDRAAAIADGIAAAAQATILAYTTGLPATAAFRAALSVGVIAASTGAKIGAISTRKFYPKKFEDGGMVNGPSHAEGGVPFTVQGRGGYEMEGGEFIVNKRSASMHKELLDRINSSGRTAAVIGTQKFAQGGEVIGSSSVDNSEEYLRVIAESSFKTAGNTGKPTRAFVSSKDLATNSRERSITNKNNRV